MKMKKNEIKTHLCYSNQHDFVVNVYIVLNSIIRI